MKAKNAFDEPFEYSSSPKKFIKSILRFHGGILARTTCNAGWIRLEIFTKIQALLVPDGFRYRLKAILKNTGLEKAAMPANMQFPAAGNAQIPESYSGKGQGGSAIRAHASQCTRTPLFFQAARCSDILPA